MLSHCSDATEVKILSHCDDATELKILSRCNDATELASIQRTLLPVTSVSKQMTI